MKKFISVLSSLAMITASFPAYGLSASAEAVKGDIDGDGKVTLSEAQEIPAALSFYGLYDKDFPDQRAFFKDVFGWSDELYDLCDANDDGKLSPQDSSIIQAENGLKGELSEEESKKIGDKYLNLAIDSVEKNDKLKEKIHLGRDNMIISPDSFAGPWKDDDRIIVFTSDASDDQKAVYGDLNLDGVVTGAEFNEYSKTHAGDADLDGKVDSKDATSVLVASAESIIKNTSPTTGKKIADFYADFNGDGSIDAKDATAILVKAANDILK